eukprot:354622-Chlamydomonas_euryale.AAC.6
MAQPCRTCACEFCIRSLAFQRACPPIGHRRRDFPHLMFSLNGGVQDAAEARAAVLYEGPWPSHAAPGPGSEVEASSVPGEDAADAHRFAASRDAADTNTLYVHSTSSASTADRQMPVPVVTGDRGDHACGLGPRSATRPVGEPIGLRGRIEGVMIGRAAYNNPWGVLADADVSLFGAEENAAESRRQVLERYCEYADAVMGRFGQKKDGSPDPGVRAMVKPLTNLFYGAPGSKRWKSEVDTVLKTVRRRLHSGFNPDPASVREVVDRTLHFIPADVLDAPPQPAGALPAMVLGALAAPGDRAGLSQSLMELKKAVKADAGRSKGGMKAATADGSCSCSDNADAKPADAATQVAHQLAAEHATHLVLCIKMYEDCPITCPYACGTSVGTSQVYGPASYTVKQQDWSLNPGETFSCL